MPEKISYPRQEAIYVKTSHILGHFYEIAERVIESATKSQPGRVFLRLVDHRDEVPKVELVVMPAKTNATVSRNYMGVKDGKIVSEIQAIATGGGGQINLKWEQEGETFVRDIYQAMHVITGEPLPEWVGDGEPTRMDIMIAARDEARLHVEDTENEIIRNAMRRDSDERLRKLQVEDAILKLAAQLATPAAPQQAQGTVPPVTQGQTPQQEKSIPEWQAVDASIGPVVESLQSGGFLPPKIPDELREIFVDEVSKLRASWPIGYQSTTSYLSLLLAEAWRRTKQPDNTPITQEPTTPKEMRFSIYGTLAQFTAWVNEYELNINRGKHIQRDFFETDGQTYLLPVLRTANGRRFQGVSIGIHDGDKNHFDVTLEVNGGAARQDLTDFYAAIQDKYKPNAAPQLLKHEPLKCNQWLFIEYFDKGNTNLKAMLDEWKRIHREEDLRTPVNNPIASMRTAINEEKGRRRA